MKVSFLCQKSISVSACYSFIYRRCLDKFFFTYSIRFAYSRCENHKDNKAQRPTVLAERTRLRQYIGATIFYFLYRQGGSNLRIFWGVHLTSLIQKVNQMCQHNSAVRAKNNFYPRFVCSSRQCLLLKLQQAERETDFLEENDTFKMQIPLDRHSHILMPNDCQLPNTPYFSLPSSI